MKREKQINIAIAVTSLLVPALVAVLFYSPALQLNLDVHFLPRFHAILNSMVSILLVSGLVFIRQKNIKAHRWSMLGAFLLSAVFLVSYVIYHASTEPTRFGGEGLVATVSYILLISHIVLAAIILPFILVTLSRALTERFDKHRKIARITFPLWLYVAVTGVLVYVMISPYY